MWLIKRTGEWLLTLAWHCAHKHLFCLVKTGCSLGFLLLRVIKSLWIYCVCTFVCVLNYHTGMNEFVCTSCVCVCVCVFMSYGLINCRSCTRHTHTHTLFSLGRRAASRSFSEESSHMASRGIYTVAAKPPSVLLLLLGAAREGEAGSKQDGHRDLTVHTCVLCLCVRGRKTEDAKSSFLFKIRPSTSYRKLTILAWD